MEVNPLVKIGIIFVFDNNSSRSPKVWRNKRYFKVPTQSCFAPFCEDSFMETTFYHSLYYVRCRAWYAGWPSQGMIRHWISVLVDHGGLRMLLDKNFLFDDGTGSVWAEPSVLEVQLNERGLVHGTIREEEAMSVGHNREDRSYTKGEAVLELIMQSLFRSGGTQFW